MLCVHLFQYDANYVGTVLPKEVTFCNLNNNINDSFLRDMCKSHGLIDDVSVYYHPKTRRHLGIGTVLYHISQGSHSSRNVLEFFFDFPRSGKSWKIFRFWKVLDIKA